jgi:hypothetical protein
MSDNTDEVVRLQAEVKRLRAALEPFANVVSWADACASDDRDARLPDAWLHINTRASSFAHLVKAEKFTEAYKALRNR